MPNFEEMRGSRRRFIGEAGVVLLTVLLLPPGAGASIPPASTAWPGERRGSVDSLIIRSSSGFVPHTHDLAIPFSVLKAPPTHAVQLVSTRALGHTHPVILSQRQLVLVSRGGSVSVAGGSHTFVIALARGVVNRSSAPQKQRNIA